MSFAIKTQYCSSITISLSNRFNQRIVNCAVQYVVLLYFGLSFKNLHHEPTQLGGARSNLSTENVVLMKRIGTIINL